ncbi:unnamed protein product, partial [Brenthis ino]
MNNIANSTSPVLNSMENRSEVEQYNENEELYRVEETEENTNLYTKKRYRDEDDTEMWTLVSRNSKRKYRRNLSEKSLEEIDDKIEVCITSKEKIPKQIELARFLKEHNILNIIRVKYATPYKIFVLFEEESDAEKMITSTALQEKGWKCYKTSEVGFSYGIIRDIELDLSEKDVQLSISSDLEIISVKRLFRRNDEIPEKLKNIIFIRRISLKEKITEALAIIWEWLISLCKTKVLELPIFKNIFESVDG